MMLLDMALDTEIHITSNIARNEILAESFTFQTTVDAQPVDINIFAPITVHQTIDGNQNGAFRVYMDGDSYISIIDPTTGADCTQWNGDLLCNGGAWCVTANVPVDGRFTASMRYIVAKAGLHTVRVQYAGTTTYTIGTLRSRRRYQIIAA